MWAKKYDCCISCGTEERRHLGHGLCSACYQKEIENRNKSHERERGVTSIIISKEYLVQEYEHHKKSLSEIAQNSFCSRQYIYKKMKEYGVPFRSKGEARTLALDAGKITYNLLDDDIGISRKIKLQKIRYDENFFRNWSNEMAYVLGVIYTDGNIKKGVIRNRDRKERLSMGRLSIAQKEPELLIKVLNLMKCNAKLTYSKKRIYENTIAGELYHFRINSNDIYDALLRLGVSPYKSLTINFPIIPNEYIRHFIRGCWDGDGSVYREKEARRLCASFVSGSYYFISGILKELIAAGLPEIKIHKHSRRSYSFRYSGKNCIKLYHYLYDNVPREQYLERKFIIFDRS